MSLMLAEVRLPILTRVRGHIRLNCTGHLPNLSHADLVFALHHCDNFAIALSEAVGNGLGFRSVARFAAGSEWMGYRMWSEIEGRCVRRFRNTEVSACVEMAWRHRVDAVRGTYDEDRAGWGVVQGQTALNRKARARGMLSTVLARFVYSELLGYLPVQPRGVRRTLGANDSRRCGLSPLVDCSCGGRTPCPSDGTSDQIGRLAGSVAALFGRRQRPRWERRHALKRRIL